MPKLTALRLATFVAERNPLALPDAVDAFAAVGGDRVTSDETGIDGLRRPFRQELARRLEARPLPAGLPDTTPGTTADRRMALAREQVLDDCDGFLRRAAI